MDDAESMYRLHDWWKSFGENRSCINMDNILGGLWGNSALWADNDWLAINRVAKLNTDYNFRTI